MKEESYSIKGTLVRDHIHGYSYNLTSKHDAIHLCTTLNNYEEKLQLYKNITSNIEKANKSLIQIQLTLGILQHDVETLKEALK